VKNDDDVNDDVLSCYQILVHAQVLLRQASWASWISCASPFSSPSPALSLHLS